jgi:hypothetical protein
MHWHFSLIEKDESARSCRVPDHFPEQRYWRCRTYLLLNLITAVIDIPAAKPFEDSVCGVRRLHYFTLVGSIQAYHDRLSV